MSLKKDQKKQTETEINTQKTKHNDESIQTGILFYKKVTIIYINTTFSSIVFIAYQTSTKRTSHDHCFWNLSHNHNTLYNIVSFQFSPDIQNCIYQFCTHSAVEFQVYNVYFGLNTRSISTLDCGIGYITCVEQNQPVFSPMASPYKHTSAHYATVSVTFHQRTIIKFCQWHSIYPMTSLSIPNLSKN